MGSRGDTPAERSELLSPRRRRLAWAGFVLLAGYAPVVAWLQPGDTWLMPVAVAGLVGYVIVIDDVLRRRAARAAQTATRGRRVDDPGSISDAPLGDAISELSEPVSSDRAGQLPDR